jgi:predicted ArsR family transcriptional regulator
MISRILGQAPERVESMAAGSHLCTYLIKDKKAEAAIH